MSVNIWTFVLNGVAIPGRKSHPRLLTVVRPESVVVSHAPLAFKRILREVT
jgi:hypothetical protein